MIEEDERRANAVKEALKLTPEESAVVIIKKESDKIFCLPLNISNFEIVQILASGLLGSVHNFLTEEKISRDFSFLVLEKLCEDLKDIFKKSL